MGVLQSSWGVAAVCAVASLCAVRDASAYRIFQEKLPNGGNVPGVAALGHDRPDSGGPNNDFGLDFIGAMFKWTKELCEKDSDGDGQTNGQELGDPCCEFEHRVNEQVRWTEGVSHPGDPELTSNPAQWEGIVCGADAKPTEEAAKATEPTEATKATEKTEEKAAPEEKVEQTVLEAAVQGEAGSGQQKQLGAGAPALQSSVMLSAVLLTVVVLYFVVMRTGRRSARNLPIFRQQRRGHM